MQRGVGNVNPMKMAICIMELERIYGIKNGGRGGHRHDSDVLQLTHNDKAPTKTYLWTEKAVCIMHTLLNKSYPPCVGFGYSFSMSQAFPRLRAIVDV